MSEITDFIDRFKGAESTFMNGCCYWFAEILVKRFMATHEATIYYEPVEGHFITKLAPLEKELTGAYIEYIPDESRARLYDIRGDVTDLYNKELLFDIKKIRETDRKWYRRLMRDCRDFRPTDDNITEVPA